MSFAAKCPTRRVAVGPSATPLAPVCAPASSCLTPLPHAAERRVPRQRLPLAEAWTATQRAAAVHNVRDRRVESPLEYPCDVAERNLAHGRTRPSLVLTLEDW
jgi:hypothetical protein